MTTLDVRRLLTTLVDHDVQFVVAGMGAAVLQGAPTTTQDLDVVMLLDFDNYEALATALNALNARRQGAAGQHLIGERDLLGRSVKRFLTDAGPVDVLPELLGVGRYELVAERARTMELRGRRFLVARLEDVLASKEASARDKDWLALPVLRATIKAREADTT